MVRAMAEAKKTRITCVSTGPSILMESVQPSQRKLYNRMSHLGWSRLKNRMVRISEQWTIAHPNDTATTETERHLRRVNLSWKRLFDVDVFFRLITPTKFEMLLSLTEVVDEEELLSTIFEDIREPGPKPFDYFLEHRKSVFAQWVCQAIIEGVHRGECYPWTWHTDSPIFRRFAHEVEEFGEMPEGIIASTGENRPSLSTSVMQQTKKVSRAEGGVEFDPRELECGERGKAIAIALSMYRSGIHKTASVVGRFKKANLSCPAKRYINYSDWFKKDPENLRKHFYRLRQKGKDLEETIGKQIPDDYWRKYS